MENKEYAIHTIERNPNRVNQFVNPSHPNIMNDKKVFSSSNKQEVLNFVENINSEKSNSKVKIVEIERVIDWMGSEEVRVKKISVENSVDIFKELKCDSVKNMFKDSCKKLNTMRA